MSMMNSGRLRRGRGAGRGDHDVAGGEHGVEIGPRRGARAADRLGGACGVRHRAADDRDVAHFLRLHVDRRQLAHLAGADHHDVAAAEIAEDLARERDGGVAHRDGARAEAGLRPHALADGERRVEEAIEHRPRRARVGRGRVRLFHLPEDLRLADHERIEAGRHAEQMPRRLEVREVVGVRRHVGGHDLVVVAQEAEEVLPRRLGLLARDVHLRAVARRHDDRLARGSAPRERAQRRLQIARLEIDALAQLHRRGAMTQSDEQQMHQLAPSPWPDERQKSTVVQNV